LLGLAEGFFVSILQDAEGFFGGILDGFFDGALLGSAYGFFNGDF
jgi:hypothetical protein